MKHSLLPTTMAIVLMTSPVLAAARDDLGNCYAHVAHYLEPGQREKPARELTVLIDQTVVPDKKLKQDVYENVIRFIRPGDKINIIAFSAYSNGHYTEMKFSGVMDRPLPEKARDNIPMRVARKFDHCLKMQWVKGRKLILRQTREAFSHEDTHYDFTNTELIGALNTLTTSMINKSSVEQKTLLIFSDMLENSKTLTFFSKRQIRTLSPAKDIKKVTKAGMIPDLKGVKVYVIGAGWVVSGSLYQDSTKLTRIRQFWEEFFTLSKASLEGFGEPLLMVDLE